MKHSTKSPCDKQSIRNVYEKGSERAPIGGSTKKLHCVVIGRFQNPRKGSWRYLLQSFNSLEAYIPAITDAHPQDCFAPLIGENGWNTHLPAAPIIDTAPSGGS